MKKIGNWVKEKVQTSLNRKLCVWITISLFSSIAVGIGVYYIGKSTKFLAVEHVSYEDETATQKMDVINFIEKGRNMQGVKDWLVDIKGDVYLVNTKGEVIVQRTIDPLDERDRVNLEAWRNSVLESEKEDFHAVYAMTIEGEVYYLCNRIKLSGEYIYTYEVDIIFGAVIGLVLFISLIYIGMRKKVRYIEYISSSIDEIAKGNLNVSMEEQGKDELCTVAKKINVMEKSLKELIQKEVKGEKRQRELITNVSHDLKTPLTVILGYLDIVMTGKCKDEEEQQSYLAITYEKAQTLQKMVFDLFELVKLGDDSLTLSKTEVNLNRIIRQAVTDYEPIAQEKNISLQISENENEAVIYADIERISRVITNLLDNAVKYSPEQETVDVDITTNGEDVLFTIANVCNNVKKEDVEHLFERFYRAEKHRNSEVEGSGIGLSIVQSIIEAHSGSIWATLEERRIIFHVRLRIEQ